MVEAPAGITPLGEAGVSCLHVFVSHVRFGRTGGEMKAGPSGSRWTSGGQLTLPRSHVNICRLGSVVMETVCSVAQTLMKLLVMWFRFVFTCLLPDGGEEQVCSSGSGPGGEQVGNLWSFKLVPPLKCFDF